VSFIIWTVHVTLPELEIYVMCDTSNLENFTYNIKITWFLKANNLKFLLDVLL